MTKTITILCIVFFTFSCASLQKNKKTKTTEVETVATLLSNISSNEFQGRKPGTKGMELATEYIIEKYQQLGLKPLFNNSFRDTFHIKKTETYNLIGLIQANEPTNNYVIISAHLDHIGTTTYGQDTIYNGANDNASGVVAVLKVAEVLKQSTYKQNVIVALFSGEESGQLGSKHFVNKIKKKDLHISYMVNFEMIGVPMKNAIGKLYVTGYDKSNFAELGNNVLSEEFLLKDNADKKYGLFRLADNYPIYSALRIPAHTVSSYNFSNYSYYHHVKDEFSEMNVEHMESVISKTSKMLELLLLNDVKVALK